MPSYVPVIGAKEDPVNDIKMMPVGGDKEDPVNDIKLKLAGVALFLYLMYDNLYTILPVHVDGNVDKSFEDVRAAFRSNFESNWESEGASVAVFYQGKKVVDLWGGYSDRVETIRGQSENGFILFVEASRYLGKRSPALRTALPNVAFNGSVRSTVGSDSDAIDGRTYTFTSHRGSSNSPLTFEISLSSFFKNSGEVVIVCKKSRKEWLAIMAEHENNIMEENDEATDAAQHCVKRKARQIATEKETFSSASNSPVKKRSRQDSDPDSDSDADFPLRKRLSMEELANDLEDLCYEARQLQNKIGDILAEADRNLSDSESDAEEKGDRFVNTDGSFFVCSNWITQIPSPVFEEGRTRGGKLTWKPTESFKRNMVAAQIGHSPNRVFVVLRLIELLGSPSVLVAFTKKQAAVYNSFKINNVQVPMVLKKYSKTKGLKVDIYGEGPPRQCSDPIDVEYFIFTEDVKNMKFVFKMTCKEEKAELSSSELTRRFFPTL